MWRCGGYETFRGEHLARYLSACVSLIAPRYALHMLHIGKYQRRYACCERNALSGLDHNVVTKVTVFCEDLIMWELVGSHIGETTLFAFGLCKCNNCSATSVRN